MGKVGGGVSMERCGGGWSVEAERVWWKECGGGRSVDAMGCGGRKRVS